MYNRRPRLVLFVLAGGVASAACSGDRRLPTSPQGPLPAAATSSMTSSGLTLVPTYDANVGSSARTTIDAALAEYSTMFSNPQSFGIYFYDMASGLGESSTQNYTVPYASYRAALAAASDSRDDLSAVASMPAGTIAPLPLNGSSSSIVVRPALGLALGLSTPPVTFSSGKCAGFTGVGCVGVNITAATAAGNLRAVVQHEVNEILGLGSALDSSATPSTAWAEDLFRWSNLGVRAFSRNPSTAVPCDASTPYVYFSQDGGNHNVVQMNNCDNGGEYGDWKASSPSVFIQDAFLNGSGTPSISYRYYYPELVALDVIGYTRARAPGTMTSPTPGSTLSAGTVTFQWTAAVANTTPSYYIDVWSTATGAYILSYDPHTATTATVTGLPTDGRSITVRLWSGVDGVSRYKDYVYTASTNTGRAQMTSPTPGSTLSGGTVTFQWNAGQGTRYWLDIGSTVGGTDIYSSDQSAGLSRTVSGLPTNGQTVYVRLTSYVSGSWSANDYTYTAATTVGSGTKAVITSPANGSTLPGSTATFQWSAGTATRYWIDVGTTVGGTEIGSADRSANLNATVSNLPTSGQTVYVRLWSYLSGGWASNDYSYQAATGTGGTKATMTSPTPGSTLSGSSPTFTWNGGTGTRFWLDVGSTPGGNDIFSADRSANLNGTATGVPTDGRTVYVRLWTFLNGAWVSNDYTYVTGP